MRQSIKKRGFTLVELLAVVLILGALAAVALPRVVASADTAKERACQTNIKIINRQVELYKAVLGSYPKTIDIITKNADYFPEGTPACPLNGKYSLNSSYRALCSHSGSSITPVITKPIPVKPIASPIY